MAKEVYPDFSDISDEELLEASQAAEYLNELGFENLDVAVTSIPSVSYLFVIPAISTSLYVPCH